VSQSFLKDSACSEVMSDGHVGVLEVKSAAACMFTMTPDMVLVHVSGVSINIGKLLNVIKWIMNAIKNPAAERTGIG
jgi:hypothetical protein